jgi:hypothetical protein
MVGSESCYSRRESRAKRSLLYLLRKIFFHSGVLLAKSRDLF